MAIILDIASDPTPRLSQLWTAGFRTVFGYMSSINPTGEKCWTAERVKAAAAVGFRIGLVHEGWGGVGGKGISALDGMRDGKFCRAKGPALGAPQGAAIYFACDQDFSTAQIASWVLPYFDEIADSFNDRFYRIGVYGSGAVCTAVKDAGLADLTWEAQSKGWASYSAWLGKADMVQGAETKIAGLDVDADMAHGDIGDYAPDFSLAT
jgi:hypothetical protein